MATVTENVIIDFQVNTEELTGAQEQLAKTGKVDSKYLDELNKRLKSAAGDTKALITEFKKAAATASLLGKEFEDAFMAGIQDALEEAGVSAEEFADALGQADKPAKSLKAELKELKVQLAQMKLEGKDNTAEFAALRDRAGELADSIADANAEIANAGSDTRNIDNIVGSISALASGFSVAQGAAALFGDESEDVQKALLKVNAAMAIATGVQNLYNASLKEGSLAKLSDVIATNAQVAIQKVYTLVTGRATAATTAFKIALATTGIGLLVVGVIALTNAFYDNGESLDDLNKRLDDYNDRIQTSNELIQYQTSLQSERAKAAGKAESDIMRIQANGLLAQYELIKLRNETLKSERDSVSSTSEEWFVLNKAIDDNLSKMRSLSQQIEILNVQGAAAVASEAEEQAKKAREEREKAAKAARDARIRDLQDTVFFIERQLLAVEEGSAEELELKKKLVLAKRDVELAAENVTAEQTLLIQATAIKNRENLDKEYFKKRKDAELQALIDNNAAALENIKLSYAERLDLSIQQLQLQAQQEENAAQGNAERIKLIQAKLATDISELRNAEIDRQLSVTLASEQRNADAVKRIQEKILSDEKSTIEQRVAALDTILAAEMRGLRAKLMANEQKEQSDEDYVKNYEDIIGQIEALEANHNDRMADLYKQDKEARQAAARETIGYFIEYGTAAVDFLSSLASAQTEREAQALDAQRQQLDALLEAGAISEQEAAKRAKELDRIERENKQRAAERDKREALFRAVLAVPAAYLKGLTDGGPIVGAIYAGLAAVQAAIIASKPVPKFFRGKRNRYEGEGIVADMGAELVERDGRMYLYTKPTQTYLGANDKVYTAAETRKLMHNERAPVTVNNNTKALEIDYERLAKAIPQSNFSVNINKDFIEESVANGLTRNRYYDKWYKF